MTELEYATIYLSISYTNNKCIQKNETKNINFILKKMTFLTLEKRHIQQQSFLFILYYYCSFSCFLTKILPCAFLSREALSYLLNRQTMDFKLPHDVVCTCAKRDEPPSRRRPANPPSSRVSFFPQILQNDGRRLRGILSIPCIQWTTKFVCIRVNSWF